MSVGVKYDGQKPRWSLLPTDLLWGVVGVLEHGARKYSPNNWMHVPNGVERYSDAAARHLAAIERGEANDPDSGLPHAYHYVCSAMFLAWHALHRPEALKAWQTRGAVVVAVEKPWTPPSLAAIDARWLADQADEAALRAERLAQAKPDVYLAEDEYGHGQVRERLADGTDRALPEQHEHVFELTDGGTSQIRRWVCSCGDSVTHENGTNVYKRHFKTGEIDVYNTYFAATRAR